MWPCTSSLLNKREKAEGRVGPLAFSWFTPGSILTPVTYSEAHFKPRLPGKGSCCGGSQAFSQACRTTVEGVAIWAGADTARWIQAWPDGEETSFVELWCNQTRDLLDHLNRQKFCSWCCQQPSRGIFSSLSSLYFHEKGNFLRGKGGVCYHGRR